MSKTIHRIYHDFASCEFFIQALQQRKFYWNLSDSKSPQVSRILFSILANLNPAIFLIVSIRPSNSNSSSSLSMPFRIVPSYDRYSYVPKPSQFSGKPIVIVYLRSFFYSWSGVCWDVKVH